MKLSEIIGCQVADENGEIFTVSDVRMIANCPDWIYIGLRNASNILYYVSLDRYDEMISVVW